MCLDTSAERQREMGRTMKAGKCEGELGGKEGEARASLAANT